jgi:hypothetical protein
MRKHLRIHGDNIVECERAVEMFRVALGRSAKTSPPSGSLICPTYVVSGDDFKLTLECIPGFRRWNQDILELVTSQGGGLREAADVIITEVKDQVEVPLLAFEFCAALPAGNQAWQRSGRGYSFASANVPYFFLADLGGVELADGRVKKAERTPNPAVPFSYISFALQSKKDISPVYSINIGTSEETAKKFANVDGYAEFYAYLRAVLLGDRAKAKKAIAGMHAKALSLVLELASSSRDGKFSAEEWTEVYDGLVNEDSSVCDYLTSHRNIPWSKTAYIEGLTATFGKMAEVASRYSTGLTSSRLPACLIAPSDRRSFCRDLLSVHPKLTDEFKAWLGGRASSRALVICWVMGFKPRGDDARPDRGLPPFVRMLAGPDADILTIVYGPLSGGHWEHLEGDMAKLKENGLWQSVLECSDALIVDAKDRNLNFRDRVMGFTKPDWQKPAPRVTWKANILVDPTPLQYGENDIDSLLHVMFSKLSADEVFECSCNPPGGDWSGISLISPTSGNLLRYLTLPRVSASSSKRPDHVFQLKNQPTTLVIVESKEKLMQVEDGIGPRLDMYLKDLFATAASVEKGINADESSWCQSDEIMKCRFKAITVGAGLYSPAVCLMDELKRTQTDMMIGVRFQKKPFKAFLYVVTKGSSAGAIADLLDKVARKTPMVEVVRS